ncbi:sensor histidine kinase [Aureimonas psammosilenae]|uniref:sensor histidine kinase n=1 Tax=Aureimonas psammosilenae TaxID=2495496 RepID=UPI00186AAF29|nr:HWE histidine kinase domain-containing protein [Aureimonas psammosilenae]
MSADEMQALSRDELEADNARLRRLLAGSGEPGGTEAGVDDATRDRLAVHADLLTELRLSRARARLSEERLALAFEASGSLGWWDWDVGSDILHASPQFARMYGVDPERAAAGVPIAEFVDGIHPEDREEAGRRIARTLNDGGDFMEEYRLLHRDGTVTWVHARGHCYLDEKGQASRFPGVAMDITARKLGDLRKLSLVELGDRLREADSVERIAYTCAEVMARTLGATRAGFGTVDVLNETVMMQPDWQAPGVASIAGLHRFRDYGSFIEDLKRGEAVVIGDVTADPRTSENAEALLALGIRVLVNLPIMEHGHLVAVAFVHHDKPHLWLENELNFVRAVGDRTQAAIGRLRAEEQQRLLNRELGHRLKNNLAMVQAIAAQTLRNAPSLEAARLSLSNRLATLGRAHELLLSGTTDGTDIAALTQATLAVHDDGEGRVRLSGSSLELGASAALSLALVLHELATNAAKYGALSVPDGHVAVEWTVTGKADDARLDVFWSEHGGPTVTKPERRGFGSRLIERGLAGTIGGEVDLDFRTEGLRCRISAPLAGLSGEG